MLIQDGQLLGEIRIEVRGAPPHLPDVHVRAEPGQEDTKVAGSNALVQDMGQPDRAGFSPGRRDVQETGQLTTGPTRPPGPAQLALLIGGFSPPGPPELQICHHPG